MRQSFEVAIFVLVSLSMILIPGYGQSVRSAPQDNKISLEDLLYQIGNKFDCHFTIEIGANTEYREVSLTGKLIKAEPLKATLEQELERLMFELPNLTYRIDSNNPKVIHLIDGRLVQMENYAMDQTVKHINFAGRLRELPSAIAKLGPFITSNFAVDTYHALSLDTSSNIRVNQQNKTVREILTDSLDLSRRGRVLWIAATELGRDKTTYVRFLNNLK